MSSIAGNFTFIFRMCWCIWDSNWQATMKTGQRKSSSEDLWACAHEQWSSRQKMFSCELGLKKQWNEDQRNLEKHFKSNRREDWWGENGSRLMVIRRNIYLICATSWNLKDNLCWKMFQLKSILACLTVHLMQINPPNRGKHRLCRWKQQKRDDWAWTFFFSGC
jgi:hypothetical protein